MKLLTKDELRKLTLKDLIDLQKTSEYKIREINKFIVLLGEVFYEKKEKTTR